MTTWTPVPHDSAYPVDIEIGDHVTFLPDPELTTAPRGNPLTGRVYALEPDLHHQQTRFLIAEDGDIRPTLHTVDRDAITHLACPF